VKRVTRDDGTLDRRDGRQPALKLPPATTRLLLLLLTLVANVVANAPTARLFLCAS